MIEATDFFQKIRENLKGAKPLVAFRKPGKSEMTGIFQESREAFKLSSMEESGFVFAPFNPEQQAWVIPLEKSEVIKMKIADEHAIDSDLYEFLGRETDFELMEEDQVIHEKLVQKAIEEIGKGELRKVVLARSETVQVHDPDVIRIFKKLLHTYSEAYVYLWYHPETGVWLGATPESLIKAERNRLHTMALAGTRLYEGEMDVKWGEKEVEEQALVTQFIEDSLGGIQGVENLKTGDPQTVKAGNLLHIRTEITGNFRAANQLGEVIKELHPTPAVCGLPKHKALQFILENEKLAREYYSGYLGELNMVNEQSRNTNRKNQENRQFKAISRITDLYVNLRCMKLHEGNAEIYVGGGITRDSNAADEWMETVNKSQTMKSVLVK